MTFDCPPWPPAWPEIEAAALAAIRSGQWGKYHSALGKQLQMRLQDDLSAEAVRLCCSGTAALEIALKAAQVGPGDEVIVAAYDFPGNFRTIELVGATPVLVDLAQSGHDSGSNGTEEGKSAALRNSAEDHSDPTPMPVISINQFDQVASDRVRAVVVSHLHGAIADVRELRQRCDELGWVLIEDVCQAIGARSQGALLGSFGHLATFSFGGSKLVSAGSGGAVVANEGKHAARLGSLIDRPGDTYPLSPLQAAVIGPQLDRLEECNRMRSANADFLSAHVFPGLADWTPIGNAMSEPADVLAYYKYAWLVPSSEVRKRLIQTGLQLGLPLGEGFRSMSRSSPRRCRKPVATPGSDLLGERLVLMDHRALMVPDESREPLADALCDLYRQVAG